MATASDENSIIETRLAVLETQMEGVQEGQRQIIARLDSMDLRFDSLNSRIDRIFYTILALGIAAIGTLIALEKVF